RNRGGGEGRPLDRRLGRGDAERDRSAPPAARARRPPRRRRSLGGRLRRVRPRLLRLGPRERPLRPPTRLTPGAQGPPATNARGSCWTEIQRACVSSSIAHLPPTTPLAPPLRRRPLRPAGERDLGQLLPLRFSARAIAPRCCRGSALVAAVPLPARSDQQP